MHSKIYILLFFLVFLARLSFAQSDTIILPSNELSDSERVFIRKANTAKFALYMGGQEREFIKLMNLCRTNGPLFLKYVNRKYGDDYARKHIFYSFAHINEEQKKPFLRPSFGLYLPAAAHAIMSGIICYEGHAGFMFRVLLFLNLNTLVPGVVSGENCEYGSRKAIDTIEALLGSPGHRANIMNKKFMRTGVARKLHFEYRYNYVSIFSGPKLKDVILRRKEYHKYFKPEKVKGKKQKKSS